MTEASVSVEPTQEQQFPGQVLLVARGRVMGQDPFAEKPTLKANGPGNRIDGARLCCYDTKRRVVTVRVDHSTVSEFWLELEIPMDTLRRWVRREEEDAIANEDADASIDEVSEDDEPK